MKRQWDSKRKTRLVALACVAGVLSTLLITSAALAGERQFLVMLAHSPKEYNPPCDSEVRPDPCGPLRPFSWVCQASVERCVTPCQTDANCQAVTEFYDLVDSSFVCNPLTNFCVLDLPNTEDIRRQYFDKDDDAIGSFAEYMEEISYGDVIISELSRVTDWINLPWAITPPDRELFRPEDEPPLGANEAYDTRRAMVIVDVDGDPNGVDNGPFLPGPGSGDVVWMPGERFVDMDEDGRWDALDEAQDMMCHGENGCRDICAASVCSISGAFCDTSFLTPVSARVGCPEGQSCVVAHGRCSNTGAFCSNRVSQCPGGTCQGRCRLTGAPCVDRDDCSLPSDACVSVASEQPCGGQDEVQCRVSGERCGDPADSGPRGCSTPGCGDLAHAAFDFDGDGSFTNETDCVMMEFIPCTASAQCPDFDTNTRGRCVDGLCAPTACVSNTGNVELPPCCDQVDDGQRGECIADGGLDITFATEGITCGAPIFCCEFVDVDSDDKVDIVEPFEDFMVRWSDSSPIWIVVDENYIRANYPGNRNQLIGRTGNGYYNSPDWWQDTVIDGVPGSSKMQRQGTILTRKPDWYEQMWEDWFPYMSRRGWTVNTPRMVPLDTLSRRCFEANRGGRWGDGTGWVGCSDLDAGIIFATSQDCVPVRSGAVFFDEACDFRVLPEERDIDDLGDRTPLVLYDGRAEFVDLPSSKYHQRGDGRLGEVTSPFSNNIWGEDLGDHDPATGRGPDSFIEAAGPYATHVHGNLGYDAGNVLALEMLTWSSGHGDRNLDGLVDQGTTSVPGDDYYLSGWGFGRRRLVEDTIEVLDDVIDFDEFVDAVTLDRVTCGGSTLTEPIPSPYRSGNPEEDYVAPGGICSGIILLPENVHGHLCQGGTNNGAFCPGGDGDCPNGGVCDMGPACDEFHTLTTYLFPIHNEDGLNDYPDSRFPRSDPQFSWNILFHDLIRGINVPSCSLTIPTENYQVAYAAHLWLRTWEGFADLYDYDVFRDGGIENCPTGLWDVMAEGGLVHPAPILKEKPCTDWIKPVDLTTVLTPGVEKVLTLPPAEFVRDGGYFFLENNKRPGERYYFWSQGSGFDERTPGPGMLIMHTDFTPTCSTDEDCPAEFPCQGGFCEGAVSNPDAPPPQQRTGTRPTYLIVQADGQGELEACSDPDPPGAGDDGDPWPGSTGATRFSFNTNPPAIWYTQNSWTGIDISDVVPDGEGSVQVRVKWVPTSIPSLSFLNPPGGESVNKRYQVRYLVTDVYGGTTIELFRIPDEKTCTITGETCARNADCPQQGGTVPNLCRHDLGPGNRTRVSVSEKSTPGTNELSANVQTTGLNGRFAFFAKLIPGAGADGTEDAYTRPQAGRNNDGDGSLTIDSVSIDNNPATEDKARLETWVITCIDNGQTWRVNSNITQPVLDELDPDSDSYPKATTGQSYTSIGEEVSFRISEGAEPFTIDDSFTFTTTGVTAVSQAVTAVNGVISLDPVAVIVAGPLAGDPPLTVSFDGRNSRDPNGEPMDYRWDFGDGSVPTFGAQKEHEFDQPGTYTVVLRATNRNNGRFGEAAVDVEVTNNSPRALVSADRTSGQAPLEVQFNSEQSSDRETRSDELTFHWDYGDGWSANDELIPGTAFRTVRHTYRLREDGTACTINDPCNFTVTLTVYDTGGKQDSDTLVIRVGNTNPVPVITPRDPQEGPDPLTIVFNGNQTFDPDSESLTIEWIWGDGSENETWPPSGPTGSTDGRVPHTYRLRPGESRSVYETSAIVYDGHNGEAKWGPITVTVTPPNTPPVASFLVDPLNGFVNATEFNFDASSSNDPDGDNSSLTFSWNFGDGTTATGKTPKHIYTEAFPEGATVTLTVTDEHDATGVATKNLVVVAEGASLPPVARIATGLRRGAAPIVLTFDGRPSYDLNGNTLQHTWRFRQGDAVIETRNGALVTRLFDTPGEYTVELTVSDGEFTGQAGPETILITQATLPPDDGGGGTEPPPGQATPGDSADQRPGFGFCGAGMIGTLFASLLGLSLMRLCRRRRSA